MLALRRGQEVGHTVVNNELDFDKMDAESNEEDDKKIQEQLESLGITIWEDGSIQSLLESSINKKIQERFYFVFGDTVSEDLEASESQNDELGIDFSEGGETAEISEDKSNSNDTAGE